MDPHERSAVAGTVLRRLVNDLESYAPFSDELPCRTYVQDVVFEFEPDDLSVIASAAEAAGDDHFYIYSLESEDTFEVEAADALAYYSAMAEIALLENLLLSPTASWVVYLSTLDGAMVASSPDFMRVIRSRIAPDRLGIAALTRLIDDSQKPHNVVWATGIRNHLRDHECLQTQPHPTL